MISDVVVVMGWIKAIPTHPVVTVDVAETP